MIPLHEVFTTVKLTEPENRVVLPGAKVEANKELLFDEYVSVIHDE